MMLAQIAEKRGQKDRALEYLGQAATTARAGHVQRLLSDAEEGLAEAYRARGDLVRARDHALSAVKNTELAGSRFTLPVRLGILADIYAAQGRLVAADRLYDQAADIVEGIMVNVPSRDAQARLIGVMSNLYAGQFRLVADGLHNPAKAYQVVERARARALADVLRSLPGSTQQDQGASTDQMRAISRLQVRLMKARVPAERKQILDELWEAEQRVTLKPVGARIGPLIAKSRVGIVAIESNLRADEAILEYVLTEPHSYCLVITHAGTKLVGLASRKQIEELADRFTTALRDGNSGLAQFRVALYDAVLRPVTTARTARRIFVVPDGRLHLVPFDALMHSSDARVPVVTTVPSANVFYLLRTRRASAIPERPLLAIGGVPYDRMFPSAPAPPRRSGDAAGLFDAAYPAKLQVLASAEDEVHAAAQLLGANSIVLTGDRATESALKAQDLGTFEVLHFAVHAFAEPKFPERAALVILSDPVTGDDGLLQPREIGQFRLNARVVVLSACDTSVGPTVGQEGVLNIARAFLLAGAQSVITTLWAVSDATSTTLMRRFYENLTAGRDVAEALTRAKQTVAEQLGADALPTVAAFQLVGVGDQRIRTKNQAPKATSGNRSR
jgi:CHAT domain-containing protein